MPARFYWRIAVAVLIAYAVSATGCSHPSSKDPGAIQNRFVFDGVEYEIAEAKISGYLPEPERPDVRNKALQWSIYFKAIDNEEDEDFVAAPHVDFDGLESLAVRDWRNLAGISASWSRPINDETNSRYGMTYDGEHQLITRCTLKIVSRNGTQFRVVATGENESGQSFAIDAAAEFAGIRVEGTDKDNEKTVENRLSQNISIANLKAGPYELDPRFEPLNVGHGLFEPIK
jgi:hypothetical protein